MPRLRPPPLPVTADQIAAAICRRSFTQFVRRFWHAVPGAAPLRWNWHMDVICGALQGAAERVFAGLPCEEDLIFSIPPGTSKSSIASILFPAWLWARGPTVRIICASHTSELVLDLAVKSRDVIGSEQYRRYFPGIDLKEDTDTKGLYRNTHGGDRLSCTVAGRSPIGFHGHFLIVDDPLDPKKALSEVEKYAARHFMEDVLPSRKVDKEVAVTVLVMQRLGGGDPTDVMLDAARRPGGRRAAHYCLPAELTDDVKPKELAQKYQDSLLDKSRLPRSVLDIERSRNAFTYATQYLQKPTLPGGGMFKVGGFNKRCRSSPMKARRVFYIDRASATTPGACFTAGVLLAKAPEGDYHVEDVVHGRWEPDERNAVLRAACMKYRRRYGPRNEPRVYVEAEGGSSGHDAWKGVARALAGFPVREDRVTGSKDVRAEPWASAVAAGIVWLVDGGESEGGPHAEWDVQGFVDEHVRFKPDVSVKRLGGYKDRVDAAAAGFAILSGNKPGGEIFRALQLGGGKKGSLRAVVTHADELPDVVTDRPALLVVLGEAGDEPRLPNHSLERLSAWTHVACSDIDLHEVTDWQAPVSRTECLPEHAALSREQARKVWGAVLRRYEPACECVVFCGADASDRRPLSMAYAWLDVLRLQRDAGLFVPSQGGEGRHVGADPPNRHCYETFVAGRQGL
jgi:hypothetical protein